MVVIGFPPSLRSGTAKVGAYAGQQTGGVELSFEAWARFFSQPANSASRKGNHDDQDRIASTAALFTFGLAALGGTVVAIAAPANAETCTTGTTSSSGTSSTSGTSTTSGAAGTTSGSGDPIKDMLAVIGQRSENAAVSVQQDNQRLQEQMDASERLSEDLAADNSMTQILQAAEDAQNGTAPTSKVGSAPTSNVSSTGGALTSSANTSRSDFSGSWVLGQDSVGGLG